MEGSIKSYEWVAIFTLFALTVLIVLLIVFMALLTHAQQNKRKNKTYIDRKKSSTISESYLK